MTKQRATTTKVRNAKVKKWSTVFAVNTELYV